MDLMPENPIQPEKKRNKLKISLILVVITMLILVVVAIVIYVYTLSIPKEKSLKIYFDNVVKTTEKNQNMFLLGDSDSQSDDELYVSIKQLSDQVGYNFLNGEYKQFNEDTTKCYVTNQMEIVTFSADSNEIKKYEIQQNGTTDQAQSFKIDKPIIYRGNQLYISRAGAERAFNVKIAYSKENKTIKVYTLNFIAQKCASVITDSDIMTDDKTTNLISYSNKKALLYNYVIVKDPSTELYGMRVKKSDEAMYELETYNISEYPLVITPRYSEIQYIEGTNDFIVKTTEGQYGIIGADAITKVKPAYSQIKNINKDLGLYLVTNKERQSVINQNGKIIVYSDFDQIGLDTTISDPNVTNRYILLDSCIPVKVNDKWGLIDINGNKILDTVYDNIGCSLKEKSANNSDVVVIPKMKAIVVEVDSEQTRGSNIVDRNYGLVSTSGETMINPLLKSVYATTYQNVKTYYMTFKGDDNKEQTLDIVDFWETEQKKKNGETIENTQQNTANEQTQNVQ